jgi:hypothetical protein
MLFGSKTSSAPTPSEVHEVVPEEPDRFVGVGRAIEIRGEDIPARVCPFFRVKNSAMSLNSL